MTNPQAKASNLIIDPMQNILREDNLGFMIYTITDRAVPLASSGVKPGAQRLLWSMWQDGVRPDQKPRKSAKLTSSATGNYHPHGQAAMYDTLVTLASPFYRLPLIEGIGSFGMSPGDEPAADRYTEARLSPAGASMIQDVIDGGVPMRKSYDGELDEPEHLAPRFPALLARGASGIAEAWATTIPEHNPIELIDAALIVLDNPDAGVEDIMQVLPAPDWGVGGVIVGEQSRQGIRDYFSTGKGQITVRCHYQIKGKTIIIDEVPPLVLVPTLLHGGKKKEVGLRQRVRSGEFAGVSDVQDLSGEKNGLTIEITVKRGHDPETVMEELLAATELETTVSASVVALDDHHTPKWWNVPEYLQHFIATRKAVVLRRTRSKLDGVEAARSKAAALAAVALDKERAVQIIMESENTDEAVAGIAAGFDLSDEQARHVVEMPLRRLTKADRLALQRRLEELNARRDELLLILGDDQAPLLAVIRAELQEQRAIFVKQGIERKTRIRFDLKPVGGDNDMSDEDRLALWKLDAENAAVGDTGTPCPKPGAVVWAATSDGGVKSFAGKGLPKSITPKPLLGANDPLLGCGWAELEKTPYLVLVSAGSNSKGNAHVLKIRLDELPSRGVTAQCVRGMKLTDGDRVIGAFPASDADTLLMVGSGGYKAVAVADLPEQRRGAQGRVVYRLTKKELADQGLTEAHVGAGFKVNGKQVKPDTVPASPRRAKVRAIENTEA